MKSFLSTLVIILVIICTTISSLQIIAQYKNNKYPIYREYYARSHGYYPEEFLHPEGWFVNPIWWIDYALELDEWEKIIPTKSFNQKLTAERQAIFEGR